MMRFIIELNVCMRTSDIENVYCISVSMGHQPVDPRLDHTDQVPPVVDSLNSFGRN